MSLLVILNNSDVMDQKTLLNNIKEYMENAKYTYGKKNFNSAITLFFKALVAACDLELFKKFGIIPSSHENRFRLLQKKMPDVYKILDRDFPLYIESYTTVTSKDTTDLVKSDVEQLIKKFGTDKEIA